MRPHSPRSPLVALLGCGLTLLGGVLHAAAPNPRERIDFWRSNYTAVRADTDPRAARAQTIFQKLVQTAGRRPGVEPRLHVIAEDPGNVALPIAIPDGWIVISQRVLEQCYRQPGGGDDRLAFVLAHELSHQLEDDFWHMKFFQAVEALGARGGNRQVLTELRHMAALSDKVLAKELRADELGITYAVMAGFDARAVTGNGSATFFHEWVAALDPARLQAPGAARTHPQPEQRAAAVSARLRQVAQQAELFSAGLMFYSAGDFARAVEAFDEFRRHFPGREVHHNLASAYHQLALRQWRAPTDKTSPLFKLSIAIDPVTRASRIAQRGAAKLPPASFEHNLAAAIKYYQLALAQDPTYLPSYRSLGSAYVLQGEPYKAIAVMQDGLKHAPADAALLNNLGVAFFYAKNPDEAKRHLLAATRASASYDAPWFNLGSLAQTQGDLVLAREHWQHYLELDPISDWANVLHTRHALKPAVAASTGATRAGPEPLHGMDIGLYEREVPKSLGAPVRSDFPLSERVRLSRYPAGVITVSLDDEIRLIATAPGYRGQSQRGIQIGSRRDEVLAHYGTPLAILASTSGESLLYPRQGLTFTLHQGQVSGWLVYWD